MVNTLNFFRKKTPFNDSGNILLSSSFISFMRVSKKSHEHKISKILGRKVAFVATSCAVKETDFDDQVCDDALKSMKIKIIRCSHKGKSSELQCLTSTVAGGNKEGFIVATNEDVYVERLQE
nr:hypothetical protein [Tanacetum cinerariifolium]